MTFGHKLRLLREANRLTQKQIAPQLPITQSGYGKIERYESDVTIERVNRLAEILNVDPKILTTEEGIVIIVSGTGAVTAFLESEFTGRQAANPLDVILPRIDTCTKEELAEIIRTLLTGKIKMWWWVFVHATYLTLQARQEISVMLAA